MSEKFFISTPIYYPNGKPHLGHAYTSVLTDFLSRYYKLKGFDVFFSTGVDEHGQKIQKTAEKFEISPQEHVDKMREVFKDFLASYNIDYTRFIRTTDSDHKNAAQYLWQKLVDKDYIFLDKYSGWYHVSDEAFIKPEEIDKVLEKEKKAITKQGKEVIWLEEECYYFRLSKMQDRLLKFYEDNPDFVYPKARMNEVIAFASQSLKDLAVSRTSISWGIPVPKNEKHVMYVWIDALTNYLTVLDFPSDNYKKFWKNSTHILGKDILRFHAIYWPAFLLAADIAPPKKIVSHGWWLIDNDKMSKSFGNVIDPVELLNQYDVDQIRWFFLREMIIGDDANVSEIQLKARINELANNIGNLFQRATALIHKKLESRAELINDSYKELVIPGDFFAYLDECVKSSKIEKYSQAIFDLAKKANIYIDEKKPWDKETDPRECLGNICLILELLAKSLYPIMPEKAKQMLNVLNINDVNLYSEFEQIKNLNINISKDILFSRV